MKKSLATVLSLTAILLLGGCKKEVEEKAIARVFDNYLYVSELSDAIPDGSTPEDSAIIAKRFIDTWVKDQLMLRRAEEALSDEQKNFEKKIEEYRTSLLIYSYRQKLLQQKLDTAITEYEINKYYEENINSFILNTDIVKATYVKVKRSSPNLGNVRRWIRSEKPEDLDELEKYCLDYADKFDTFNNEWVYFSTIMQTIPFDIPNPSNYLRYNKNIETSDSLFHYYVHISDHKTEGDQTPVSLIEAKIKSILLNKRKIEFYNDLESQVYNDGVNKNQFEIFR